MILDIVQRKDQRTLEVSYIKENGQKDIITFNANRVKTYKYDANGAFKTWNGARCSEAWTGNPSKFDIKTFIAELEPKYRNVIMGKTFPKLYSWDIETDTPVDAEPNANFPCYPITTISIGNADLSTIVLGWKDLTEEEQQWMQDEYDKYLEAVPFVKTLKLKEKPRIKYMKFDGEEAMLKYFLEVIVANVPVLAGWNCMNYDWTYIVNRIKEYFPFLSVSLSSKTYHTHMERFTDTFTDQHYSLPMPDHTWIADLMDIISQNDYVVLPEKEAMNIDYIANATMGINKLDYSQYKSLENLLRQDYPRYVLYNGVDSLLVQLIDKYFKTMLNMYMLAQYCEMRLPSCTSKIAMTEAMVFREFHKRGLKIVWEERNPARGKLLGAYVKSPKKGLHKFCCCNDFASLYPSTIVTCNLSFENFIGHFWNDAELAKYYNKYYIVFGPNVFVNDTPDSKNPTIGKKVGTFLDEASLAPYRDKPDKYFVTVNGSVYDNTYDSAFKTIQKVLKSDRNVSKYLSKNLDAHVMSDLEHIMENRTPQVQTYHDDEVEALKEIGYDIKTTEDLYKYKEQFDDLKPRLQFLIVFHNAKEQSMKILGNSMYGGSSHISFYWYNMDLANDITGEARNLTLLMEEHLSHFWRDNWTSMTDWHKKWGIEVDAEVAKKELGCGIIKMSDSDTKGDLLVYGDTDSLYSSWEPLLRTIKGYDKMSDAELRDIVLKINLEFLDAHNNEYIDNYYKKRGGKSIHAFELETISLAGVWLDKKKNYAQILLWKDGKIFDMDHLKLKAKGLEVIKGAWPKFAKKILHDAIMYLFSLKADDKLIAQKMNILMQERKREWMQAPLNDICGSVNINGYASNVGHIKGVGRSATFTRAQPEESVIDLQCKSTAGRGVKGAYNYNRIKTAHGIGGESLRHGKVKWYIYKNGRQPNKRHTNDADLYSVMCYEAMNYPEWLDKYAPVDRNQMFETQVIAPINRIMEAIDQPLLHGSGMLSLNLFASTPTQQSLF